MDLHEDLLRRWSKLPHHDARSFISDGIIDPVRWVRAPRKVMFLLKEAYDDNGIGFDLREKIRDWAGPKYNTWYAAAYWAYAAQNWSRTHQPPAPSSHAQELADALLSAAVVNIKKSRGKKSSDMDEIRQYAQMDAALLWDQVALIEPDIVICGNTFQVARDVLWPGVPLAAKVNRAGRQIVVDFWHPAVHWPHELQYYALGGMLLAVGMCP